jgi:hypothetical protein
MAQHSDCFIRYENECKSACRASSESNSTRAPVETKKLLAVIHKHLKRLLIYSVQLQVYLCVPGSHLIISAKLLQFLRACDT